MPNMKDRKLATAGDRSFFRKKFKWFVSAFVLCAAMFFYYSTRLVVAIEPEEGKTPVAFAAPIGETWKISFTHSVERTTWDEFYRVEGLHKLTMTHTRFESLGWGYPYSPADGKFRTTPDGKFEVEMNRPYQDVALRISEQAMQSIVHGNDRYDLIALYGQGTAIQIKVIPRYEFWLKKYFDVD